MTRSYTQATRKALGFSPQCDCGDPAVAFLQIHHVDLCTWFSEGRLLCGVCLHKQVRIVQDLLLQAFLGLRPDECSSCGLLIRGLDDIIVRVCPLWIFPEEE